MGEVRRYFRWLKHPQLFIGFVAACLCLGAISNIVRVATAVPADVVFPRRVKGAQISHLPPEPNCAVVACLALSFDDGPEPTVTPRVLDILDREHVHATFFVVGRRVAGNESILRRMHQEGHEIGNHSWDHADFTKLSPAQMDEELRQTQLAISNAGVPAPRLFRPPYGAVNDAVKAHSHMAIVRWDIDPADWESLDSGKILESVLAQAKPGGIILMHDIYGTTADALDPAIQQLEARGYQFVTVSQLMNLSPGDQGQYFGAPR